MLAAGAAEMGEVAEELDKELARLDNEAAGVDKDVAVGVDKERAGVDEDIGGADKDIGGADKDAAAILDKEAAGVDKDAAGLGKRSWNGEILSSGETQEAERALADCMEMEGLEGVEAGVEDRGGGRLLREKINDGDGEIWIAGEGSGGESALLHHPMLDEWKVAASAELELPLCGHCGYACQSSISKRIARARKKSGAPGSLGGVAKS